MKRTPPIGIKGIFELKAPWVALPTKTYTCIAVRSFKDIYERGHDVYESYYEPKALDKSFFSTDAALKPNIVTLLADDNEIIYVPDTHILNFPTYGPVRYQRIVVTIDFGVLPDYVNLEHVMSEMGEVGTKIIGKKPESKLHVVPSPGVITPEEHEMIEASRLSNIDLSDSALLRHIQDQTKISAMASKIKVYEQIITDAGLLSEP